MTTLTKTPLTPASTSGIEHDTTPQDITTPRLPRGRRTAAAVIVATVLLLLAVFAGWQAILVQAGRQPYPLDAAAISTRLNQTSWNDVAVLIAGIVLAVLGLWLLLLAITPARRTLVELREDHPDVATGMRPADLRRALAGAAERIDGVSSASVSIGRGSATVAVSSPLGNPAGLADKVTAALTDQLGQLHPVDPLVPRVQLAGRDR